MNHKIIVLLIIFADFSWSDTTYQNPDLETNLISAWELDAAKERVSEFFDRRVKRRTWKSGRGNSVWGATRPPRTTSMSPATPVIGTNSQMKCMIKRFDGLYFYGKLNGVAKNVDTINVCVAICWILREKGHRCSSVNHLSRQKKCEIMDDQLNSQRMYLLKYLAEQDPNAVYVIPVNCNQDGDASNLPSTPESVEELPRIPPVGSCGHSFVEPRISNDVLSGRSNVRIVGGTEARPHSFPWLVGLQEFGDHFCGGTLIRVSPNHEESDIVITAAHCLYDLPASLKLLLGGHNLKIPELGQVKIASEKYIWHPEYDSEKTLNDIGIVKMKNPVKFTTNIQPACLPEYGDFVETGQTAIVAGWGSMQENRLQMPNVLMQVPVSTLNFDECSTKYYPGEMYAPQMFCAGHVEGGRDSCQGDSGGPLNFKTPNGWVVRGVVSFGEGCARAGKPGVYANVSLYIPWLKEKIAELTSVRSL